MKVQPVQSETVISISHKELPCNARNYGYKEEVVDSQQFVLRKTEGEPQ